MRAFVSCVAPSVSLQSTRVRVSVLLTTTRHASTGNDGKDKATNKPEESQNGTSTSPPSSAQSRTAWTSPIDVGEKAKRTESRQQAAHDRLTSLFERHQSRARQHAHSGMTHDTQRTYFEAADAAGPSRTIFTRLGEQSDNAADGDLRGEGSHRAAPANAVPPGDRFDVDEDAMADIDRAPVQSAPRPHHGRDRRVHAKAITTTATSTLDALEQELLDDAFHYFSPVALSTTHSTTTAVVNGSSGDARGNADEAALAMPEVTYVPGQQIIPPGFTRYRVDVQYQGADFDGWYKSSTRRLVRRHVHADGTVQVVPLNAEEERAVRHDARDTHDHGVARDGVSTLYHAKTVLEDALAVALDVPTVSVVASVIPEVGVSVRRLPCHVDIPSDVEMQPRTILQRATLWLQQRQQPLAILSCHRCRNQDFHARHGQGVRRVYCYRILNRVAPPLFDAGFQWHVDRHLDVARMQRFAAAMEGTRDFGYFADPKMANALRRAAASRSPAGFATRASLEAHEEPLISDRRPGEAPAAPKDPIEKGLGHLQRAAALPTFNEYGQTVVSFDAKPRQYFKATTNMPTVRTIDKVHVVRQEDEVLIWFVGQSFLRHQIRHMVSVLKAAGHGLWDELELQSAFQSSFEVSRKKFQRERLPPAPVCGLTLWDVEYPQEFRDDYVPFVDSGPYEEVDISSIN